MNDRAISKDHEINETTEFFLNASDIESNLGNGPNSFIGSLAGALKPQTNEGKSLQGSDRLILTKKKETPKSPKKPKAVHIEEKKDEASLPERVDLLSVPLPGVDRRDSESGSVDEQENIKQIFNQKTKKSFMPRGSMFFKSALEEMVSKAGEEKDDDMEKDPNSYFNSLKKFNFSFDNDRNMRDPVTKMFNKRAMTQEIVSDNEHHFSQLENYLLKGRNSKFFVKFVLSIVSDFIQAVLAFSSVIIYVVQTYGFGYSAKAELIQMLEFSGEGVNYLFVTELVVTIMGTLDYVYSIIEAKRKIEHLISPPAIIDLVTMVPFYLALMTEDVNGALSFLHVMQIFKILRVLRLWRLFKDPSWDKSQSDQAQLLSSSRFFLMRQFIILTCAIIAILFIGAGVFREIDAIVGNSYIILTEDGSNPPFTLFDGFYLMGQVLVTAGIGDIVPSKISSRILLIVFIVLLIVVIYDQVSKLRELYSKLSPHDFEYKDSNHIVILGDCPEYSMHKFLYEAFSSMDLQAQFKRTLIVGSKEPSLLMLSILQTPLFEGKVKYVVSNHNIEALMLNCNITKAKAIFVLTGHINCDDMNETDCSVMLLAKSIHDLLPYTRKVIQVNELENAMRLYHHVHSAPMTTVYSTRFIKSKIISASIFAQGITTIFGNCLNSYQTTPLIANMNDIVWFLEYAKSIKQEIYCVKFSHYFVGLKFNEAVELIFTSKSKNSGSGILLFGVKTFSVSSQSSEVGTVLVNPSKYKIRKGDFAILIANDINSAEFVSNYSEEVELSNASSFHFKATPIAKESFDAINKEFKEMIQRERAFTMDMDSNSGICNLYFDNLEGKLSGHIIIVAPIEYFSLCLPMIRQRTSKPVLYLSDKPAGSTWERCSLVFPNIIYGQCDLFDLDQLNNAAISDAFHVIIFCVVQKSSISADSTTLLLVNTLDCFFDVPYTFELYDENQMRFLGDRAKHDIQKCRFQYWPKFIAGRVFLSSLIDSMATVVYLNDILIEIFTSLFDDSEQKRKPRLSQVGLHFIQDSSMDDYQDHFLQSIEATDEDIIENPGLLIQNKSIFRIPLPQPYVGKYWEELVRDFLRLDPQVIPFALVTRRYERSKMEPANNENSGDLLLFKIINNHFQQSKKTKTVKLFENILEQKKCLELPLVISNPLQTTRLLEGDSIIILGNVVDREAIKERQRNREFEKPNPNTTKTYIESLVKQKQLSVLSHPSFENMKALHVKRAEFLEISLMNIRHRIDKNVDYNQKIKKKTKTIEILQEKISLLKEELEKMVFEEPEQPPPEKESAKDKLTKIIVRKLLGFDGKIVRGNLLAGRPWNHGVGVPEQVQSESAGSESSGRDSESNEEMEEADASVLGFLHPGLMGKN